MITKVQENRLRRVAKRQGQMLYKSRARDPRDITYGLYRLGPPDTFIAEGGGGFTQWFTIEQIADRLQEPLERTT